MITRFLLLANVAAFVWELVVSGGGILQGQINDAILSATLMPHDVLVNHQYYRIITCAFLHGSVIHILVNMISLASLGFFIERVIGSAKMFLIYFISLVAASLAVVYFAPNEPTLGASGAIFGLFGALFAMGLKLGPPGMALIRANTGILILNLIITFTVPGIAKQAHVGGLLAGFLLTLLVYWPPRPVRSYAVDQTSGQVLESQIEP